MEKLIVTVCPTGNVPTRENSPYSALTVDEIVSDIAKCRMLGASVAHIHVRDNELKPTSDRQIYRKILDKLETENIDIIKQVSTGARGGANTVEWRGQMLDLDKAQMASLATGSSNFAKSINANSPDLIEALAKKMYDNNLVPEIEVFDAAMLFNAIYYQKKGVLKGPLHINLVMNVPGSIPGTSKNLMFLIDNLPEDATWTVSGIGPSQVQMLTMAIAMGGHVRTGLEDVIYFEKGVFASNEMLIKRVINIAKAVGRKIATVEDTKKILKIKK